MNTQTQEALQNLFNYQDGVLTWKNPRGRVSTDTPAGTVSSNGYRIIKIDGKVYLAHRLVFLIHHGFMPEYIDHIDGNRLNNRIENLREATKTQNGSNMKLRSDNKTGFKGVTFHKTNKRYHAQLKVNGTNKHVGYFDTVELANDALVKARNELHGEFANHG